MKLFGLIGHPLGHSFSQAYFNAKFEKAHLDCHYQNFDLKDISKINQILKEYPDLQGFNVTIPYKEAIIPYLDEIDEIAAEIGAVNTVKVMPDGRLKGFNTDANGFEFEMRNSECGISLTGFGNNSEFRIPNSALILGSGGASKAVQYVLKKHHLPYHLVSRDPQKGDFTYDTLTSEIIKEHLLIINATPVGMAPLIDEAPLIPYEAISHNHILIDLIYNPLETLFLRRGKQQGAKAYNGLAMLYAQAEASWKIWNS